MLHATYANLVRSRSIEFTDPTLNQADHFGRPKWMARFNLGMVRMSLGCLRLLPPFPFCFFGFQNFAKFSGYCECSIGSILVPNLEQYPHLCWGWYQSGTRCSDFAGLKCFRCAFQSWSCSMVMLQISWTEFLTPMSFSAFSIPRDS